ncbi:hypothetical protein CVT24_002438 [Panaeolus cyanescens]|uniref:CCHC-type domain-containing protein n=1 Tax=Panaeolus cyanescens TaxID=181874 RepID=A0A409X019_9AGAR|nr:hypothetical protein CVT24_002438 [Panaeolus cyanescens]
MGLSADELSGSVSIKDSSGRLPKLDESGSNWITWKTIIYGELLARGLFDHIEGLAPECLRPVTVDGKTYAATDVEFKTPLDESTAGKFTRDWKDWTKNEWSAKTLIYRNIPRTIMMEMLDKHTVHELWQALCTVYEEQTADSGQFLLSTMFTTKFDPGAPNASLHAHFASFMSLRQRYIESGRILPDEIFVAALITSLPIDKFGPTMDSLRTGCEATKTPLTYHAVVKKAFEVWARIRGTDSVQDEFSQRESDATALASSKTSKNGVGAKRKRSKCSNCGKMGHSVQTCFARGGGGFEEAPDWWKETHYEDGRLKSKGEKDGKSKKKPHAKPAVIRESSECDVSDSDSDSDRMGLVSYLPAEPAHAPSHHVAALSELNTKPAYRGSLLDGGANHHFTPLRQSLKDFREVKATDVDSAAGVAFTIAGYGKMSITLPPAKGSSKSHSIELRKVFYAPSCPWTLVSQSKLVRQGLRLVIEPDGAAIVDPSTRQVISFIPDIHGLYWIDHVKDRSHHSAMVANISLLDFHRRMGHLNFDYCRKMVKHGMVEGVSVDDVGEKVEMCRECVEAKMARKPFPKASKTTFEVYGEKVVADVWGPAAVRSLGGRRYFAIFQDRFSHEEYVEAMVAKSDTFRPAEPTGRTLRTHDKPEGFYKEPDLRRKLVAQLVSVVAALGDDYILKTVNDSREDFVDICHFALAATAGDDPTIQQALSGPDRDKWIEAIKAELAQILKVHTWDIVLVEEEDQGRIIPCRWVLRIKRDALGNVSRYKARLVAKGFKQQFGVDFNETFAPTIRPATIRFLLAREEHG